jgi:hypothetical protein
MAGRQREEHQEGAERERQTGVFPRKTVRTAGRIDQWRTMHSSLRMIAFVKRDLLEMEGMGPFPAICRRRWQSSHLTACEHPPRDLGSGGSWQCRDRYVPAST